LTVDSGGLLFDQPTLLAGREGQAKASAAAIVKAYGLMGYDAVGISANDLAAGLAYLKKVSQQSRFPWLSANLVNTTDRKPLFTPFIIRKIGQIRIGIIGITGSAALAADTTGEATILPWQQVLPDLAESLTSRCDLLLLLSSLPDEANRRIAESLSGIHIILQAGSGSANMMPEQVGNTLLTHTGRQGKYIGRLQLDWKPSKRWGKDQARLLLDAQRKLDQVNWQLKRLQRKGLPAADSQDNPKLLTYYHQLSDTRDLLLAQISALQQGHEAPRSTYQVEFPAIEASIPNLEAVEAMVREAKAEINRLGKEARLRMQTTARATPQPADATAASPYLGWRKCGGCHPSQAAGWRKSRHAGSYQTLVKKEQQFNLNCLPCHVTGIDAANAPEALTLPDDRRQVGCESCHGPGRLHGAAPTASRPTVSLPPATTCLGCHTPEHDDDFDFARDQLLVH